MNIVLAGKNNIVVEILDHIKRVYPDCKVYGVGNKNDVGEDGFQRSFRKKCKELSVPVVTLESVYGINNSIFLSLEFDRIIDPSLFVHDRLYNIHFSLLPKYKGMYTSFWPILNGELETGVTLHKIDKGIDTGDIVDQISFDISENETAKSLYVKYINKGIELVKRNLNNLIVNECVVEPQPYIGASYYSKKSIDYTKVNIDFNKTAYEIAKQINAFTFRDYQLPKVFDVEICGVQVLDSRSFEKPGVILREGSTYYILSTIDYDLCVYKDRFVDFLNACEIGDLNAVRILAENKQIVHEKNEKGWSAIIVATYNGRLDIVEFLLSKGASINDVNNNGTTVLMYAKNYFERTGDIGFINKIIEYGADINKKDFYGRTVKDYVCETGNKFSIPYFC